MFITDPFIKDPFVTDHVDNGPLLNVYCIVDAKSPNHFAWHPLLRPALGTNRVCYECGLLWGCYEPGLLWTWSVSSGLFCTGLFWTGLFWTDTLQNIALQLCIITTANVLGKTCVFIFYRFSLPSNFLKSPMPYPAPGSRRQVMRCLQMTIRSHQDAEVTCVWNSWSIYYLSITKAVGLKYQRRSGT